MSNNVVEPHKSQMKIWRHVACWISKATRAPVHGLARAPPPQHTQKYVILTFSTATMVSWAYVIRTLPVLLLLHFVLLLLWRCEITTLNQLNNLLTNSTEHSPSWEAKSCSASQEISRILCDPNVHYRVHKSPQLIPILTNPGDATLFPNLQVFLHDQFLRLPPISV
jgi:hypothetical protein